MAASHLALRVLAVRQGQRIRAARCGVFFPLNPSPLPWGEGEPCSPRRTIQTRRLSTARCALFPLPQGEGQGEGKWRKLTNSRIGPFPELSNWASPPAEPEVSKMTMTKIKFRIERAP